MIKRIAVGIVVYNPGSNLFARLRCCVDAGYEFYIFDNSPERPAMRDYTRTTSRVKYFTCGANAGLGYAMSAVCAQAYYDGYPALLFFDQDTGFTQETLEFVEQTYMQKSGSLARHSAILFNARQTGKLLSAQQEFKDVDLAINSGTLYMLDHLKAMNWHDRRYFVDGVDYKFCLDSARRNLKIAECSWTPGFDHVSEQDDSSYTIFGRHYQLRAYPWFRVKDTVKSSLKLIGASLLSLQLRFTARFVRLFIIYVISQILVRGIDFVWGKKYV